MAIETNTPLPEPKQETLAVMTPDQVLSEIIDLNQQINKLDSAVENDKLQLKQDRKELVGLRMRLGNRLTDLEGGQQKIGTATTNVANFPTPTPSPATPAKADNKKAAANDK